MPRGCRKPCVGAVQLNDEGQTGGGDMSEPHDPQTPHLQ